MNFLLHRHLAARALGSSAAGHGAMLPDLWRMADRRVRAVSEAAPPPVDAPIEAEVAAGIEHHLRSDHWFHGSAVFLDGERRVLARFRAAEFVAPRMGLLAHITWELCLDGALVRRQGLPSLLWSLREGYEVAGDQPAARAAMRHHFDRIERTADERASFHGRMRSISTRLLDGSWVAAYADGGGLAEVLGAIRRRLALPALGERDRRALQAALEELAAPAEAALDELLATAP